MARPLILVVDDAPEITRVVQHLGRRVGQDVVCRGDVPGAWEYLHGGEPRPDLVLLDVNLPGVSGLELYRRLRAAGGLADLVVALFTQWSLPAVIAEGVEEGVDFVLAKDLLGQPEGWKARVDEILDLAAHPPPGGAEETGRQEDRETLVGVQEALRHPSLRHLGDEITQALWRRALLRAAAGPSGPPAVPLGVDVWEAATNLIEALAPLIAARATFATDLVRSLSYQAECLLGRAPSEPFRMALVGRAAAP